MQTSISTFNWEKNIVSFVKTVELSGASMIHCDVMDGKFVKNECLNFETLNKIKLNTTLPLDVHLMVEKPEKLIKKLGKSIANIITIHYESFKDEKKILKAIKLIKKQRCLAGLSFDINTNVSDKLHIIKYCDIILIMSVKAGEGGQKFDEKTLSKIAVINDFAKANKLKILIEVDGGVNLENISQIKKAGANIVVLGTAFNKAKDKCEFIKKIIWHKVYKVLKFK